MEFLEKLSLAGLVPVIAINDADDAVPLCKALSDGGLPVAEITFRTAAAEESIRRVHEELPNVLLCAGTVLTIDQVDRAIAAGAAAIVSPGLSPDIVEYCVSKGIPICPGTSTPSDVQVALANGLNAVKFFPAEAAGGLPMIKNLAPVYPGLNFMPTGGVNEKNMLDYLAYDRILCCGGTFMCPKDAIANKEWDKITQLTRSAVDKMLGLELRHVGINTESAEESLDAAKKLAALLGCAVKEGNSSNFAGTDMEVMKSMYLGTNGHIAIRTNKMDAAIAELEKRGYTINMESAKCKGENITAVYLNGEFGGFAVHLLQK